MPKISKEASAKRRAHILNAARLCFAEHGVHVSVDEICTRAGISKGAFYGYFDSKDAAIEAMTEDHEKVVTTFSDIRSVQGLLKTLVRHTSGRDFDSNRLELEAWAYGMKLPTLRAALQHNAERLQDALRLSLSAIEKEEPGLDAGDTAMGGEILSIFAMGMIAASVLGGERAAKSSEAALKHLLTLLVQPRGQRKATRRQRNPNLRPA